MGGDGVRALPRPLRTGSSLSYPWQPALRSSSSPSPLTLTRPSSTGIPAPLTSFFVLTHLSRPFVILIKATRIDAVFEKRYNE